MLNEVRKDFSKAERIESLKARERMSDGGKGVETFLDLKGQTRDTVASKLDIGSDKQYEKEKFISDNRSNLTPEGQIGMRVGCQRIRQNFYMLILDGKVKYTTFKCFLWRKMTQNYKQN